MQGVEVRFWFATPSTERSPLAWLEAFGIALHPSFGYGSGGITRRDYARRVMLSLLQPQELGNPNPLGRTMSIEASPRTGPWTIHRDHEIVDVRTEHYRIHQNGGGLVALTAHVAPSVYVAPRAIVKDRAIVVGSVRLFDRAVIEDQAVVADACTLRGDSSVGGEAILRGSVQLNHEARVDGTARLSGGLQLQYFARVSQGTLAGGMTVQ
jgi:hypothetical protein